MKNLLLFTAALIVISFSGCNKGEDWDSKLNGNWAEQTMKTAKSLPSSCNVRFADRYMEICGKSLTEGLTSKSKIQAVNGQIWIEYKLASKKHIEYRFDYTFDGNDLWLIEDTDDKFESCIGRANAKVYIKK